MVPQRDTLDEELTVAQNIQIYGRYFGLSHAEVRRRADELLDFAQLTDRAGSRVDPLSGGMKRRLTITRSLVNAGGAGAALRAGRPERTGPGGRRGGGAGGGAPGPLRAFRDRLVA